MQLNATSAPWDIYPRPQLRRDSYVNLNGVWEFTLTSSGDFPGRYDRTITVPFCPECALSGVGTAVQPGS